MGTMIHHLIVVTSWRRESIAAAHEMAVGLGLGVSEISPVVINGYKSFAVWPDGSKEGWRDSNEGDQRRDALVAYLERQRYEGGSTPLAWCEVEIGECGQGGAGGANITRHGYETEPSEDYSGPADLDDSL